MASMELVDALSAVGLRLHCVGWPGVHNAEDTKDSAEEYLEITCCCSLLLH